MTSNQREIWRSRWLNCIYELTSIELQTEFWLNKTNTNPHFSFIEFMCTYFDDLAIDNNYKGLLDEGWVTIQEFEIIKNWHTALDNYYSPNNNDYDNEAVLKDPKWLEIMQIGIAAKNKLSEILSEGEKQLLIKK